MAFLEELGRTLTGTGKEMAEKARVLTETLQLNTQKIGEKTKMEEAYAVIGKLYYDSCQEPGPEYEKAFKMVKSSRERIAALEIELSRSEGSHICAECGARVPKDSLFCGKCGAPIKEESVEEEKSEEDTVVLVEEPGLIQQVEEGDFVS